MMANYCQQPESPGIAFFFFPSPPMSTIGASCSDSMNPKAPPDRLRANIVSTPSPPSIPRLQIGFIALLLRAFILVALWTQCVASHLSKHDSQARLRFLQRTASAIEEENFILDDSVFKRLIERVPLAEEIVQEVHSSSQMSHQLNQSSHSQPQTSPPTPPTPPPRPQWEIELNLANKHLSYMRAEWSCSEPRPKLVKVDSIHGSEQKKYIPRCTVLHRCGDDTGCCEALTHNCEPDKTEMVQQYFHVIRSDIRNNITGGSGVGIEQLTFLNHTKCACKPINHKPRTVTVANQQPSRRWTTTGEPSEGQTVRPMPIHHHGRPVYSTSHKCKDIIKCPEPFVRHFRDADKRCVCECHSSSSARGPERSTARQTETSKQCHRIKSGITPLDEFGARCVRTGDCSEPVCNLGLHYAKSEARCTAGRSHRHQLHQQPLPASHHLRPSESSHHHGRHRRHRRHKRTHNPDKCIHSAEHFWNCLN